MVLRVFFTAVSSRIKESDNKIFKIKTIKVPCKLQCLPALSSYKSKQQIEAARNANPQEILQVLADSYNLQVDGTSQLDEKSYPIHFAGFISEDIGRCYYLENSESVNKNTVDIEYILSATCMPWQPIKATLGYKVVVKSEGEVLAEHEGEVDTINFGMKWLDNSDINKIITTAQKIPSALQQDIKHNRK